MSIVEKIEQDLFNAMKEKNAEIVRTLRMAMSSIKYAEKEKRESLDDLGVISVLQKEVKIRQETMEDAKKGNRQDIIAENEHDIKVLEKYLPQPLTEAELDALVQKIIEETGAESMKDMGKVMPVAVQQVNGRAPNNVISQAIRKFLAG
ncbi:MAG TPA: GatB/YqeY domain-containing protein [Anaerolineaceae bacterium]|nr:GatB/YqeY domain-containing protein [Anaerolineaceae bacterium]